MKRFLAKVLMIVFIADVAAGCTGVRPASRVSDKGSGTGEAEPVTLDWYINYSWYKTPWGNNAVSEAITDKTGVDIRFLSPDGSESVNMDALVAGNKLPDLVTLGWWEPQLNEIIDKGLAYALNELADTYDAGFWEVADSDRIRWYTKEDGNVYCYPNSSYSPKDYEEYSPVSSNQTFLVRKDIYEAIGCMDMTTTEGFQAAVRKAAEKFPIVDGKPLIPVGAHEFTEIGCDSFDKFLQNFLAVPFEKNGKAYDRYTDPDYKRWLLAFRQLGEEGLLASDIFTDKRQQMEEKIAQGRYFCMIYQRTDMAEQQLALYSRNPERIYMAVDGPKNAAGDMHTLPGSGISGWTVTLISKNCRDPERAIRFLSFLMSEEGQKLIALGIEGENYQMVDGRAQLTEETSRLMLNDYPRYIRQVGANDTYWMLQDNRMQAKWMPLSQQPLRQMEEWTYPYVCYTNQYEADFTSDSDVGNADKRISSIHGQMLPRLLLAPTEKDFEEMWQEYVNAREESGIADVLAERSRQMKELKMKLGIE